MAQGEIKTIRAPIELDYLAAADTALTLVPSGSDFQVGNIDNLTTTMVDVSGNNTVRKVVVVISGREPA